jgi:hypothetical protein
MRKLHLFFVIPALLAFPAIASAGELKLSMQNGLVTLVADDVPLSAIMAEWARIGQTKIINGDKIMTPVTMQLVDMPERRALDVLLRAVSGYMVAERSTPVAGASVFDRIMILPTSRPPANTGPINSPPPMYVPRPVNPPVPDMDEDGPMPPGVQPQPNAPANLPQPMMPGQQNPNAPLTAPRPGQLPAPAPQQPVPFGTPAKPGGGGGSGGGA